MTFQNRQQLVVNFLNDNSVAAELGVAKGAFSSFMLQETKCRKLYSIDMWAGDRGHDDVEMEKCAELLAPFGTRSEIIHSRFEECLDRFNDAHFDFVYIDGYAHTGQEEGKTLTDWWPKVKVGGVLAGHDYCSSWPMVVEAVDFQEHDAPQPAAVSEPPPAPPRRPTPNRPWDPR